MKIYYSAVLHPLKIKGTILDLKEEFNFKNSYDLNALFEENVILFAQRKQHCNVFLPLKDGHLLHVFLLISKNLT